MRQHVWTLLSCAVCLVAAIFLVATIDRTAFHGDESQWIGRARAWFRLVRRDFDNPFWIDAGMDQPLLVPYIWGLVARASGYDEPSLNLEYDFEKDPETNRRENRVPSYRLLWRCRLVSTLCGGLACVAAMVIARRPAGPAAGLAAVLLLAFNPYFGECVHRAMAEGLLSVWLLGAWLVCIWAAAAFRRGHASRARLWSIAAGAAGGLATTTKLTGAVALAAVLVTGLVQSIGAVRHRRGAPPDPSGADWRLAALPSLIALGAGYLVFIAQSPATWREPFGFPRGMIVSRSVVASEQQLRYPEAAVTTPTARLALVARRLWHDFGTFAVLGHWTRRVWLDAWLFVGGLVWLLASACGVGVFRSRKAPIAPVAMCARRDREYGSAASDADRAAEARVALIWVAALLVPVSLTLPLDWDRYYLPPFLAATIVEAVALGIVVRWAARRLRA